MRLPERRARRSWTVIRAIAALALASASAHAATVSPALVSTAPWWEKVTVTVAGDGKPQTCRFESSRERAPKDCEVVNSASASAEATGSKEQYTRITFERRFSPGAAPDAGDLQTGDTLLGRQVMALAIDAKGAVTGCQIVATGGDMTPEYGCKEATAERFQASAPKASGGDRAAYLTIIVYGHAEHIV